MHIAYRRYTKTGEFYQLHSYRTKLVATTGRYKETFERIILARFTFISNPELYVSPHY